MIVSVIAYPYAISHGEIYVPDETENIDSYIFKHWGEISFGYPDLNYNTDVCKADYDWEIEADE